MRGEDVLDCQGWVRTGAVEIASIPFIHSFIPEVRLANLQAHLRDQIGFQRYRIKSSAHCPGENEKGKHD
jgi:hypothetical protein